MRTLHKALGTLLSLLTTTAVVSATCMQHPTDPSAIQMASTYVDLMLGGSTQVRCDVCTWAIAGGGTDITIDASSFRCVNGGSAVDSVSTTMLFGLFTQVAIAQAISLGYLTCPAICGGGISVHVFMIACVTRTGLGSATSFSPCEQPSHCNRSYRVCCPNGLGSPTITLISTDSPSCTGGNGCYGTCV
jgi:hypothetical protein